MLLVLSRPILYLITRGVTTETTSRASGEFQDILAQISAAVAAGIDLIQLREKNLTARVLFDLTERAVALTRGTAAKILVNDRADIAAGAGADGVHLTTQSLTPATVRRAFGTQLLIGASTHSLAEATAAQEMGADFIVCGPVFETSSKPKHGPLLGLEKLREVTGKLPDLPVLALGGVSVNNARDCIGAGASGIAGISLFSNPKDLGRILAEIRPAAPEMN